MVHRHHLAPGGGRVSPLLRSPGCLQSQGRGLVDRRPRAIRAGRRCAAVGQLAAITAGNHAPRGQGSPIHFLGDRSPPTPPASSVPWAGSPPSSTTPSSNRSGPPCSANFSIGSNGDPASSWPRRSPSGLQAFATLATVTPPSEYCPFTTSKPCTPPSTLRHNHPFVSIRETESGSVHNQSLVERMNCPGNAPWPSRVGGERRMPSGTNCLRLLHLRVLAAGGAGEARFHQATTPSSRSVMAQSRHAQLRWEPRASVFSAVILDGSPGT